MDSKQEIRRNIMLILERIEDDRLLRKIYAFVNQAFCKGKA